MNKFSNFGLLNANQIASIAGTGAAGGALWGVGYGVAKPILSGEEIDPGHLAQEVAANAAGGAISGTGLHYGGALLSKVRIPAGIRPFSMHYMSADFNKLN